MRCRFAFKSYSFTREETEEFGYDKKTRSTPVQQHTQDVLAQNTVILTWKAMV